MNKEYIYNVWAPPQSIWSNWAKPVLFACMDQRPALDVPLQSVDVPDWLSKATSNTAIILDLPADKGVWLALALVKTGRRPVPLYNAVPWPPHVGVIEPNFCVSVVEVAPIMYALWRGTEVLAHNTVPNDAPPVFLLDANRRIAQQQALPGCFDNRSISFTTDFPSANFLHAKGIQNALLIQETGDQPQPDLAHTLRRWQEGGINIMLKRLDRIDPPTTISIQKPSWFGWFCYRVLAALGLRRNEFGGFGGLVPLPGAG